MNSSQSWSTEAKTLVIFVGVGILVVILGMLAFENTQSISETYRLRAEALQALQALDGARIALNDDYASLSSYLTTSSEAALVRYDRARSTVLEEIAKLTPVQFAEADQVAQFSELVPLVTTNVFLSDTALLLRRVGLETAAAQLSAGALRSSLTDVIYPAFDSLHEETQQVVDQLSARSDVSAQNATIVTVVRTALMLGLLAASYYFIRRDLRGQRRFEQLLREERTLLRTVIDVLPVNIYVKDTELRFVLMNRAQAALVGASSPEAAIGKRDADFFPPEWVAQYVSDEQAIFRTGQPLMEREEPSITPAGDTLTMLTTKMPVRDNDGVVTQIVGVSHDITTRKSAEREIEQLNEDLRQHAAQLEQANSELEAFSYTISHDLRAPLRAIDGFSRIVMQEYSAEVPAEAKRYLEKVRVNAQRMSNLIDDLLQFARVTRQEINKEMVEPTTLVREILDDELRVERQARTVQIEIGTLPACEADPTLLRQVYVNLLSNALKFTSKCTDAQIEVGAKRENGSVVYYVRDNGAGFNDMYVDKLFGVFQRLHRQEEFGGTGAGLAIVKRVITRHGGSVWAEGAVDQGATFSFTLGDAHE